VSYKILVIMLNLVKGENENALEDLSVACTIKVAQS
jgi:hypothetical protein